MNNKSLSPPPCLSLCLSLSLRSNASLTLLPINPPSFTLTHSLHLLREHEPAAVSASLSVFELFWHMCSLSAPPTVLLPSVFPNLRGGPLLPTQDSRESGGRDRQQRRLVITTGRGSGQWPAWGGTVVRRPVLEHFFWTSDDQRTSREAKEKDWLKKSGWEEKPWTDSFTCVGKDQKFSFHSFPNYLLSLPSDFGILGPILEKEKGFAEKSGEGEKIDTLAASPAALSASENHQRTTTGEREAKTPQNQEVV